MSYEQLIAIRQEAVEIRRADKAREVVDCPVCGELLQVNSRGVKNCPLGHFTTAAKTHGEL